MIAGKDFIVVKIDKVAQRAKQEKNDKGIFLPPKYLHMLYNLQYGEIMSVGSQAQSVFPEMKAGQISIFHHSVEGNDAVLLESEWAQAESGDMQIISELRAVMVSSDDSKNLIRGIVVDGKIVPHKDWIFLNHITESMETPVSSEFLSVVSDPEFWSSEANLLKSMTLADDRMRQLQQGLELNNDIAKRVDIKKEIEYIKSQKSDMAKQLNSLKYVKAKIEYINPRTILALNMSGTKKCMVNKNLLYPLNVFGNSFMLCKTPYVVAQFP